MPIYKRSLLVGIGLSAFFPVAEVLAVGGCGDSGLPPCQTTVPGTTSTVNGSTTRGDDVGYGGLKWTFGEGLIPEVVAGYRHAEINTNGDTQGADISLAIKVSDGLQPGKLRVKYFNGANYMQGEVSGGYDFANKGFFAGIGAQGPYVNAGLDYTFSANSPFSTFLMFNSLGIYNRPHTTTTITHPSTTTTQPCNSGSPVVNGVCPTPTPTPPPG